MRSWAEVILEHEATIKASWQLREVPAGSPHRRRELFGLEALFTTGGTALFEVTVRLELRGWQTSTGTYEVEIWGRVICLRLPLRLSDHL